jgi:hypothetical protein
MTQKSALISLLGGIVIALFFNFATGLVNAEQAYGTEPRQIDYRLQTNSFLNGHLALTPLPFGHEQDWSYGNGMQQGWGLGVPLLRIPFEVISRTIFEKGFPDRLVIILLVVFVSSLLFHELKYVLLERRFYGLSSAIEAWFLSALIILSPALLSMINHRFLTYEEAIFAGQMWMGLLLATLLRYRRSNTEGAFFMASFVTGWTIVFRSSLVCAILPAIFIIVAIYYYKSKRDEFRLAPLVLAVLLFLVGPIFLLDTNYLRFGSIWEFAYGLNISTHPANEFALRIGYPFSDASIWKAARELVAFLFFYDNPTGEGVFYAKNLHPWQSEIFRYREMSFHTHGRLALIAVGTAAIVLTRTLIQNIKKGRGLLSQIATEKDLMFLTFGLSSAFFYFIFYLKSPSLASRYMCDFSTAFGISAVGAYLSLRKKFEEFSFVYLRIGFLAICFALNVYPFLQLSNSAYSKLSGTFAQAQKTISSFNFAPQRLPESYHCHEKDPGYGILGNARGWDYLNSCRVDATTVFFFERVSCLDLSIQRRELEQDHPLFGKVLKEYSSNIVVKRGLSFMERKKIDRKGDSVSLKFCLPLEENYFRPEMITIGWYKPSDLSDKPTPFLLHSIAKSTLNESKN